jgi:hypothetical protein
MGEAKRKRREATMDFTKLSIEELLKTQVPAVITQDDIPANLNVFATMEAAWQDFVARWVHKGLPDDRLPEVKFTFFNGVQAAANLVIYCEGQQMLGAALDQLQGDCIAYEKEVEAVSAAAAADEWRTGEI